MIHCKTLVYQDRSCREFPTMDVLGDSVSDTFGSRKPGFQHSSMCGSSALFLLRDEPKRRLASLMQALFGDALVFIEHCRTGAVGVLTLFI